MIPFGRSRERGARRTRTARLPGGRPPGALLAALLLIPAVVACGGSSGDAAATSNATGTTPGTMPDSAPGDIDADIVQGLDFPGSADVARTMRFRFRDPLPIYPATYIWRAYPRRQSGYYTAFFWGNDDGRGTLETFLWDGGGADSYYGAHPYPDDPPDGSTHKWEISVVQDDFVNGAVVYDRWYTQALRVWGDNAGKHHEFYWDLPRTDFDHRVSHTAPTSWGEQMPPAPALTWGDAPWQPGKEVWNGVLSGIQIYSALLSLDEIEAEIADPLSTPKGQASIWYLNLNPTPNDISDQSGRGHDPEWVGTERPSLWMK